MVQQNLEKTSWKIEGNLGNIDKIIFINIFKNLSTIRKI